MVDIGLLYKHLALLPFIPSYFILFTPLYLVFLTLSYFIIRKTHLTNQ